MRILIVCLFLLGGMVQAQDYYKSKKYSVYNYDPLTHEYDKLGSKKLDTRIIVGADYFALEKDEGGFITGWWVYYATEELGKCYITQGDASKICLNTETNEVYVFTEYVDSLKKWKFATVLKDIVGVEPFNVK